jgi:hypothetical protein
MEHLATTGAKEAEAALDHEERRRALRKRSVLLLGRLVGPSDDHLCLVHDISAQGAQVRLSAVPGVGQEVRLVLGDRADLAGTVRWNAGQKAGVEFDVPIAEDQYLRPSILAGAKRRYPRFTRCSTVLVQQGGISVMGDLVNIAQGGLCAQLDERTPFDIGTHVQVSIRSFVKATARICWKGSLQLGLAFETPLQFHQAGEWLENDMHRCAHCTRLSCPAPSFKRSITQRLAAQTTP